MIILWMASKGLCECCGKERVLREIDSGQKICTACYKEIKPPRAAPLASWAMVDKFAAAGIDLPEETTADKARQAMEDINSLANLLKSAWYEIVGTPYTYSGAEHAVFEEMAIVFFKTGDFGRRMAALEAKRYAVANEMWYKARADTEAKRRKDFRVEDCELFEKSTGRKVSYWFFKPPLPRDSAFEWMRKLLHSRYPQNIPHAT